MIVLRIISSLLLREITGILVEYKYILTSNFLSRVKNKFSIDYLLVDMIKFCSETRYFTDLNCEKVFQPWELSNIPNRR